MDIHDVTVTIPQPSYNDDCKVREWFRLIDTSISGADSALSDGNEERLNSQEKYVLPAGSIVVLTAK